TLPEKQEAWEKELKNATAWTVLEPASLKSDGGVTLTKQADGSVLASGKTPATDKYTVTATTKGTGITGVRLEVLAEDTLPAKGPGRAPNGNFVLTEIRLTVAPEDDPTNAKPLELRRGQADFSQDGFSAAAATDNNPGTGWAVSPQFGKNHV